MASSPLTLWTAFLKGNTNYSRLEFCSSIARALGLEAIFDLPFSERQHLWRCQWHRRIRLRAVKYWGNARSATSTKFCNMVSNQVSWKGGVFGPDKLALKIIWWWAVLSRKSSVKAEHVQEPSLILNCFWKWKAQNHLPLVLGPRLLRNSLAFGRICIS